MASPATDVFLSYKAEDRARLVPLVRALEEEGLTVWWDAHIGGGSNWHEDIEQHLDAANCVVVAWSKRSIGHDGQFVREEARRAQRRHAYIPVCLDPVEPPLGFGEIQALSLRGWKGDRSDPKFQALADAVRNHVSGGPISPPHAPFREPRVTRRGAIAGGIGVGTIAIAGVGGWLLLKPEVADAKRIAVLPFANLSGDETQAYFSDGIAEELRSALSRVGMEVIGRASSVAVKDLDSMVAAKKLGVANILTGSVRRSPDLIRVNAQLVSGKDGVERWGQSYDRAPGDAIKIQADIAENVARALSIKLGQAGRAAITLGGTSDGIAQDLLLQSRRWIRDDSSEEAAVRSIELAEAAVRRDPNYADAYIAKAFALASAAGSYSSNVAENTRDLVLAHAAARRALEIAPTLAPAHAVLGYVETNRLNLRAAYDHIHRALALSPGNAEVLVVVIRPIAELSDGRRALGLADQLLSLDPLNAFAYRRKADILVSLRQYPAAIKSGRKALELAPDGFSARMSIGHSLSLLGRYDEARSEYAAIPRNNLIRLTGEAIIDARTRDIAATERTLVRMRKLFGAFGSYQYAEIYAQAGDKDRAFAELQNAVAAKDPGLTGLKFDPFFDPIRGDPRYPALVKKLDFPS